MEKRQLKLEGGILMLSNVVETVDKLVKMSPYEVYEFPWGTAVKHRKGAWEKVFLKPSGQEIDVSGLNILLHENGIEFL